MSDVKNEPTPDQAKRAKASQEAEAQADCRDDAKSNQSELSNQNTDEPTDSAIWAGIAQKDSDKQPD